MQLCMDRGSYVKGGIIHLFGSFEVAAGAVTLKRDGGTNLFSVVRTSAGLFTVTFTPANTGGPVVPSRLIMEGAYVSAAATLTGKAVTAHIVKDSYSQATRSFQIVTRIVGNVADAAYTDPTVGDPNDNERINFHLLGSLTSVGTDAA